jgi:MFS transporter, ACS family, DAL5 transporter family protein
MAEKSSAVEEKIPDPSPSPEVVSILAVDQRDAGETLSLVEEYDSSFGPPTPEFEKKLRWKLYLHLTVLITLINLMLFVSFVI